MAPLLDPKYTGPRISVLLSSAVFQKGTANGSATESTKRWIADISVTELRGFSKEGGKWLRFCAPNILDRGYQYC